MLPRWWNKVKLQEKGARQTTCLRRQTKRPLEFSATLVRAIGWQSLQDGGSRQFYLNVNEHCDFHKAGKLGDLQVAVFQIMYVTRTVWRIVLQADCNCGQQPTVRVWTLTPLFSLETLGKGLNPSKVSSPSVQCRSYLLLRIAGDRKWNKASTPRIRWLTHIWTYRGTSLLFFSLSSVNQLEIIYFKDAICKCDYSSRKFFHIGNLPTGHVRIFLF